MKGDVMISRRSRKRGEREKLASVKVRVFIREYIKDLNGTQAAIRAGYAAKTARQSGSRLLSKADVREAIEKALREREERLELSADSVLMMLKHDHGGAVADRQYGPAVKAVELLGRHLGMFAKKHEVDISMSLREMIEAAGNKEDDDGTSDK